MSHPFGDLLLQFRARKRGLSQTRLAQLAGYDQAVLVRMSQGKKDLTGPSGRDRVVRVIEVLREEGTLATLDEANALLAAGDMPPLYDGLPVEAALIQSLKGGVAQKPTHRTPPRHNLPAQLTSFVGREKEMAKIVELLARAQLVTLTGAGGVGKTRLAIEAAAHVMDRFPDGVWFVDLAPTTDPALVPQVAASAFGLPARTDSAPLDALLTYLEARQLVLILDNCEHLITGCIELAERVLQACPQVRLLTTSREPLRIGGESVLRVPSLSIDDEAQQLFVDRAGFDSAQTGITASNADAVKRSCGRLEGIPLAIEIAAAQLPAMTLDELSARLDDQFPDMPGMRSAPSRQHTMQATMAWSYSLLSPQEQRLLAWLSVFSGGWTADAADAVCGAEDSPSVLPQLIQLVHKSLVVAEPRDGRTRYRLLEPMRQFAAEKLDAQDEGEAEEARRRHCDYFTALAESFEPSMIGPRLKAWCDQVHADWSNVRASVNWARLQPNGGVRLARISVSLKWYWFKRGSDYERIAWLEEAVRRTSAADGLPRARALIALATVSDAVALIDRPREHSMVDESLILSQRANDSLGIAYALICQVRFRDFRKGDPKGHFVVIEQALQMFRQAKYALGIGDALRLLSLIHIALCNETSAAKTLEELYILGYETGEIMWLWHVASMLATFNAPRSIELCEQSLAQQRAHDDAEGIAVCLQGLGYSYLANSNYAAARPILEECHARWHALGCTWSGPGGTARTLWQLGAVLGLLGDYNHAIAMLHQAASEYGQVGDTHGVAWALHHSGRLLLLKGDLKRAEWALCESVQHFHVIKDLDGASYPFVLLAAIAQSRGQIEQAMHLLGAATSRNLNPFDATNLPPEWREAHQRAIAEALAHSDDPAFVEGQKMTIDQAVAYALSQA